ncbi:MAG: hypothetical protein ABI399_04780 [Bauldia sp.]
MLKNLTFALVAVALSAASVPAFAAPHDGRGHFQTGGEDAFRNDLMTTDTISASTAAWCGDILAAPSHHRSSDVRYCRSVMHG